ncbi:MAG: thiamine biosynthesis protein ThiS [Deltaproteobacteria bacterium HGW-Deltaproteobacteria-7]|jgi:sulfur carrier protein|nr:MAG: thiamine biosynthesis protein ThiS [Deltaproteobacteria bacterium HGW-Deltaproteobacteria-7]PKN18499.1 MAG: thiamine biosynthesis protein ThiS [Deltaproteobacteria bacterium HGW-Deltaproteobacteria-6]
MRIRINGTPAAIEGAVNLEQLIVGKGLIPERVVVELNLRIIPRNQWRTVLLNDDDAIEIVSFVGGG